MQARFPFQSNPPYIPRSATVSDLIAFKKRLGIQHLGLVCISVYGTDNRSILDAMTRLDSKCRAVACIDPMTISEEELDELHKVGVRGARINLKTREETLSLEQLSTKLYTYAAKIRARKWFLELYLGLDQMEMVADVIPRIGVRVVIDHMGSPASDQHVKLQAGYETLIGLLRKGQLWVKISGTYRFNDLPDLDDYGRALVHAGPKNIVWASDWPHTGGPTVDDAGRTFREYRDINDMDFVRRCFEWCDFDEHLIQDLFVENPRRLWLDEDEEYK
nr:2-pyrone-4,6-dicarbaxylate hydrolase [Quercus suber]